MTKLPGQVEPCCDKVDVCVLDTIRMDADMDIVEKLIDGDKNVSVMDR